MGLLEPLDILCLVIDYTRNFTFGKNEYIVLSAFKNKEKISHRLGFREGSIKLFNIISWDSSLRSQHYLESLMGHGS